MDDPALHLARHAVSARFEDIPTQTVRTIVHSLIDTAGAVVAGTTSALGRLVLRRAVDNGGAAQSTLVGGVSRVPQAEAAFANAVMGRALELDDVHEGSPRVGRGHGGHVSVVIVPAVLAALEACGRAVSGRELIVAVAVGGDVMARIRLAAGNAGRLGWEGPTFGPIGVAVALANVLRFTQDQAMAALSAAYAQCAGNIQSTSDGGWDVWLNAGTAARAGVLAAELASAGFKGTAAPLLGSSGLYPLYFRGEYHEDALLGELGTYFESGNVSLKPYATCKATHHALHTATEILRRSGRSHAAVRGIVVGSSEYKMRMVALDPQNRPKTAPSTLGEAQFHLPFAMAACLVRGSALPHDLETSLRDRDVHELAARIRVECLPAKDELQRAVGYPPDDVEVHFDDGSVERGCEEYVKGHPLNPMDAAEVCEKFRRCVRAPGAGQGPAQVDEFLKYALALDRQPDARLLPPLVQAIAASQPLE